MLGVSRPSARKLIGHRLDGINVDGPGWIITRASAEAAAATR